MQPFLQRNTDTDLIKVSRLFHLTVTHNLTAAKSENVEVSELFLGNHKKYTALTCHSVTVVRYIAQNAMKTQCQGLDLIKFLIKLKNRAMTYGF